MALLRTMPPTAIPADVLKPFGQVWLRGRELDKKTGMDLSDALAAVIAPNLAEFLGGIPLVPGRLRQLQPRHDKKPGQDVVELKDILVVGGVRPQHFDVGYRPDGTRIAIDVKTLNKTESVGKNYPNMINDLTAEATTVHTRFPYALVAFLVAVPKPCLEGNQARGLVRRLEGLGRRDSVDGAEQLAEAIALVVWDPETGELSGDLPSQESPVRLEGFSSRIERIYVERYDGAAPHLAPGSRVKTAAPVVADSQVDDEESVELGEGDNT